MSRATFCSAFLALLVPTLASAAIESGVIVPNASSGGTINLSWDDCSAAGSGNKDFACDTNSGGFSLFGSFTPPPGVNECLGMSADLTFQSSTAVFPDWWRHGTGECRATNNMAVDFSLSGYCRDFYAGQGSGGFVYEIGYGGPERARMLINGGVPFENRTPLDAALEYYAFRISLGLGKTIGGNACDGCDVPMTITLNQIQVFQPTDCKECNPVITTPDLRNTVSWNGKPLGPVTVPVAPKTLALARAVGVDAHTVNVSFTLPRVSTAKLELFDVSGRLRASRSIEGLAPGDHDLSFAAQQPLGPGVYFVRLAQDGEKVSRRFSLRY